MDAHLGAVNMGIAQLFDNADVRPLEERLHDAQHQARRLVEDLGFALQASLLVRHAPSAVADAFCAARLGREGGCAYGTLPTGADVHAIVDRALPA